eukprot:scaffold29287_cov19-Tisochrysis_lutea.AAC.2
MEFEKSMSTQLGQHQPKFHTKERKRETRCPLPNHKVCLLCIAPEPTILACTCQPAMDWVMATCKSAVNSMVANCQSAAKWPPKLISPVPRLHAC